MKGMVVTVAEVTVAEVAGAAVAGAAVTHPHPPAQYQRRLQRVRLPLHPLQKVARPMDHFKAGMGILAAGHQQELAMTPAAQPAQAATTTQTHLHHQPRQANRSYPVWRRHPIWVTVLIRQSVA